MTKVQMGEEASRRGFADVMEMTWFCRRPTRRGEPCGICGPCLETRDEGLGRRVPDVSGPRRLARRLDHRARDMPGELCGSGVRRHTDHEVARRMWCADHRLGSLPPTPENALVGTGEARLNPCSTS